MFLQTIRFGTLLSKHLPWRQKVKLLKTLSINTENLYFFFNETFLILKALLLATFELFHQSL